LRTLAFSSFSWGEAKQQQATAIQSRRNFGRHLVGEGLAPPVKSAQSNIFSLNNKIPIDFCKNICYTKKVNTKIKSILF